ncbi:MAG: energy-coupling factor transporter transmembrane component T family protein [Candidatus Thorarchaeota archaeon]
MTATHHAESTIIAPSFSRDTRSKLIAALGATTGTAFSVSFEQLIWFLGLLIVVFMAFRPRRSLFKKLLIPLPIILAFGVFSFLTRPDNFVYSNGFMSASFDRTAFAIFMISKALLAICFVLTVVESESFYDVIYALDDLHFPRVFTSLLFLTYRNIFLIQAEFGRMLEARYNRNFGKRMFFNFYTLKVIGNMIGGVLVRSLKRSEHTADILVARGFQGRFPHPAKPWTAFGIVFVAFMIFSTIGIYIGVS